MDHSLTTPPATRPSSPQNTPIKQEHLQCIEYDDEKSAKRLKVATTYSSLNAFGMLLEVANTAHANECSRTTETSESTTHDMKSNKSYVVTCFSDKISAGKYCTSIKEGFGISQVGDRYDVYAALPGDPCNVNNFPTFVPWKYFKAYKNNIKPGIHPYMMCTITKEGTTHKTNDRGIVRERYIFKDGKQLKRYHYRCDIVKDQFPKLETCRNCKNPSWNAKCTSGEDFWTLE